MNLTNILTRKSTMKRAFITLESDMADILTEEFLLPPEGQQDVQGETGEEPELPAELTLQDTAEDGAAPVEVFSLPVEIGERLTAHAQNRLADLAALDEARAGTQQQLDHIGSALANLVSAHHLSRDFLNDSYADIRRASDLEILAGNLSADNRKLVERVEKLEKLRGRYDQLVEVLKRREAKLLSDNETLREQLSAAKLDAVEARNAISRAEYVHGELHTTLAAKSGEAERFQRDNELLREKNVNLALDLDKALQRQAETRRKLDDLSAIHASESAMVAKMTAKLASEEKDSARLQKLNDALESRLVEANESLAGITREMSEREELYQSESHALKSEIQTLVSRLHAGANDQNEAAAEMTALNARLNELESEKLFAERKAAGLAEQMEHERQRQADLHERQLSDMRHQIRELTETIERLQQDEKPEEADLPETAGARAKSRNGHRARALPVASV